MSKSLADLRANPPSSRPERSLTLCLAPHLVAEVQSLTEELTDLTLSAEVDKTPRRKADPRDILDSEMRAERDRKVAELRSRINALLAEMAEFEGELRVRATLSDGDWRRWVDAHPAREKDKPGHERDQRVSAGYCNADDLIDTLETYAVEWNGEPLAAKDFDKVIAPALASADLGQIAQAVVALYESRLDFPRLRSSLSASLGKLSGLNSASPSASVTSDSTDGSLAPGSEASTKTATPAA